MWVREGAALFGEIGARPIDPEDRLVDDLTPSFAGIIDRHTWAGKANFLIGDPDDLALVWHTGEYMANVAAKVAVRRDWDLQTGVAHLYIGDGKDPGSGYEGRITLPWDGVNVSFEILRQGQQVAHGEVALPVTRTEFEAELARHNGDLVLRMDGEPMLAYHDREPLDLRRVGMKLEGAAICPNDTRIETSRVRSFTFGQAPCEWMRDCGTWEVASRWSCSPGWTWFAGWDDKDAWTTSKEAFGGDQRMDMFVGAKMADLSGGRVETLRDIRLGLCARPGDISSGYRFVLGGKDTTWAAIIREGKVVAEKSWPLPQGGLHNDWTLASAVKRGKLLSLEWEGHTILEYEDPEPLASGHCAIGTYANGIMVPRVTIYGRVLPGTAVGPESGSER
jgi:hypothetical protein